jgi:tetratricopeptide (TPR) repeat protein
MQDSSEKTVPLAVVTPSQPEKGESTMFCTGCGTKNTSDANFCKQCGHKLTKSGALKFSEEDFALPQSREEKVRSLLLLAFEKYEADDLDAAIETCSEALEIRQDSTDVHSLLSTLYEKKGDNVRAIAERERVLELNPGSIADREKLDELRDGHITTKALKINSSRRAPAPVLFDSPGGQVAAAVVVMLLVLLVGAWAVWTSKPKMSAADLQAKSGAPAQSLASNTGQQVSGTNGQPNQFNPLFNQGQPYLQQGPYNGYPQNYSGPQNNGGNSNNSGNASRDSESRRQREELPPLGNREVGPAPVNPPMDGRNNGRNTNSTGGTVHLPDNGGVDTNASLPNTPITTYNPTRANPASQGRIEIVVSPGNTAGNAGTGTANTNKGAGSEASAPSMDSHSLRRTAQDLQVRGQYKRAVTEYIKSLDGAGDEAASIHQQMALCYQRLDDNENAIAQYNAAISAYKAQAAAGRNADAANRGIKACETGIKACQ